MTISFGGGMIFPDRYNMGPPEPAEGDCPNCGCHVQEDKAERSFACQECDWSLDFDWSEEAERRIEERERDR